MLILSVFMNYIHLVSVFILVGTIFFFRFVATRLMRKLSSEGDQHADGIIIDAAVRFVKVSLVIFGIIIVNGIMVMVLDERYKGLFVVDWSDPWHVFLAIKHIIFGLLMISFAFFAVLVFKNKKLLKANASTKATGKAIDLLAVINFILIAGVIFCTSVTNYHYEWVKVILYFIHLLLISMWVGGLFFIVFIGSPIMKARVMANEISLYEGVHHIQMGASRFIKVLWLAIFVSIFTGFPLLLIDSEYSSFLKTFSSVNMVMIIKHVVFIVTIMGAFVVTTTIARLQVLLDKTKHISNDLSNEQQLELLNERNVISSCAKYGFTFLQAVLILSAILDTLK